MNITSFKIIGHGCFKKSFSGFDEIKPVNVIIGRNNTGKSHLLDIIQAACEGKLLAKKWKVQATGELTEASLRPSFNENHSSGALGGNHWRDHGIHLVGVPVNAEFGPESNDLQHILKRPEDVFRGLPEHFRRTSVIDARKLGIVESIRRQAESPLSGKIFRRLSAERDIRPELARKELKLGDSGDGATNIIRRFLNTSHSDFPPERIQAELRAALNEIFGQDGSFLEIETKHHDSPTDASQPADTWEIFLKEKGKGLIALSRSGSGLKTVILVLLNLLLIPLIENQPRSRYVFAFEELENNLHPALLRRLLRYILKYATSNAATVFLTTHSSVALDVFGVSSDAQVVRVSHNTESASTQTLATHFDRTGLIAELGAKPSDLLQANGIVWVEGPSDRIYLNRWIELLSEGKLIEGRDYACAFYAGSLLANNQFTEPEKADAELTNLLQINPNIVVVCDGDRTSVSEKGSVLKARVARVKAEVEKIPSACLWITEAKEIENYLPSEILNKVFERSDIVAPDKFERFFPSEKSNESFCERILKRKSIDKVDLARDAARCMDLPAMRQRFDWNAEMIQIVAKIREWNA